MGISASAGFDPIADLVDLKDKVIIVTGGNAGIGFATVQHLARAGAKVYLGARNESRATEALAQLEAEGLTNMHWLKLDLDDPRDAKQSAEEFLRKEERLDVLVNNAGLLSGPFEIGKHGVATMTIVNYISPFVFTETLLPLLQKTAQEPNSDVRIVNLSSITHKMTPEPFRIKDIEDFNVQYTGHLLSGFKRYAHTKLLVLLWSTALQRRLISPNPSTGNPITVIAVHPGQVDTFSHKSPWLKYFSWISTIFAIPVSEGAYNSVFAAADKKVRESREAYQGAYLEGKPVGTKAVPSTIARNDELVRELEETTRRFLDRIEL